MVRTIGVAGGKWGETLMQEVDTYPAALLAILNLNLHRVVGALTNLQQGQQRQESHKSGSLVGVSRVVTAFHE